MKRLYIFMCGILPQILFAQLPLNLTKNYDFETGWGQTVDCSSGTSYNFDANISDWHVARPDPDDEDIRACWVQDDHSLQGNCGCKVFYTQVPSYTNKYVKLSGYDGAGVRSSLIQPLEMGKKYFMRIKMNILHDFGYSSTYVHFTSYGEHWNSDDVANRRMWEAVKFWYHHSYPFPPPAYLNNNQQRWVVYEQTFTSINDSRYVGKLSNINIVRGVYSSTGASRHTAIDDVELFEYCPQYMARQNRHYYLGEEKEEALVINAGRQIAPGFTYGDVVLHQPDYIYDNLNNLRTVYFPKVTYKAAQEVVLKNGFYVQRGAEFVAKIAPCGKDCPPPSGNIPRLISLCDGSTTIQIGGVAVRGETYQWTASNPEHLNHLSALNISNPVFTKPTGGSASNIIYQLIVTNACGETITIPVVINFSSTTNPSPSFTLINQSFTLTNYPSLTINPVAGTEKVIVEIVDCNNNLLHSYTYLNGIDFTTQINWSFNQFTSPCGCYRIKVKSKNFCNPDWYEQVYDWTRKRSLANHQIANVTTCINGERYFCVNGEGIGSVNVKLFNVWGVLLLNTTEPFTSSPFCFKIPSSLTPHTYYVIVSFIDCEGISHEYTSSLRIFDCDDGYAGQDTTDGWSDEGYFHDIYYTDVDGNLDSVYTTLSPNPVTSDATLNYHVPKAGAVKVSLYNSNFETIAVLVNNEEKQTGDYSVVFNNDNLPFGMCYYVVELFNEQQARIIKRFSVIK